MRKTKMVKDIDKMKPYFPQNTKLNFENNPLDCPEVKYEKRKSTEKIDDPKLRISNKSGRT